MMKVPKQVAHVLSSETSRPFAGETADRVGGKHRDNAAISAGEGRPGKLPHLRAVGSPEPGRIEPQGRRIDAFRVLPHTRTFLARAALSSTEMRELSPRSTSRPSFVIR